jgi:hypothetical protein
MPTGKGGWAALHDIQERKRRERAEGPPLAVVPTPTPDESRPPDNSQPVAGSQPALGSQPAGGLQPVVSSQPAEPPPAGPLSSQPTASSQPARSSQPNVGRQIPHEVPINLLASLPDVKGHSEIPHQVLDHLCRHLEPEEQVIYMQLYRLSWGFGKNTCEISNPRLSERSNVPLSTMKRKVSQLVSKGLVEKINTIMGYGKDQAVVYRVAAPSWQLAKSSQPRVSRQPAPGHIKKEDLKEIEKRGDASQCPDCAGSGWWYPEGTARGVRPGCQHPRLKSPGE